MKSFKYKGTPEQMSKVAEWALKNGARWYCDDDEREPGDDGIVYCGDCEGDNDLLYISFYDGANEPVLKLTPALELEIFGKTEGSLITEDTWKENTGVQPVGGTVKIDVKYAAQQDYYGAYADVFWWDKRGCAADITHWRFHKPEDAKYYVQPATPEKPTFLEDAYDSLYTDVTDDEQDLATFKNAMKAVDVAVERRSDPRNKYMREIKPGVWVDVYDVIRAFSVTDGALQHLLKKALAVGQRGHKDAATDYKDIVDSAKRAQEIFSEWNK